MTKLKSILAAALCSSLASFAAGCSAGSEVRVAFAAPMGLTDEPVTSISVMFDREIVSDLDLGEARASGPLKLTPAVAGVFRWDHTDEVVFVPAAALPAGQTFKVEIDAALVAVDGSTVQTPFSWTIQAPALPESDPE